VPELIIEFLALALVDVCHCEMLVSYTHRNVSTQESSGKVGDPDTSCC
jgi:hypothetical protein